MNFIARRSVIDGMKAAASLAFSLLAGWGTLSCAPSNSAHGSPQATPGELPNGPRHVKVIVRLVTHDGSIVTGGFYDWASGEKIPTGNDSAGPNSVPALETRWKALPSPTFIRGLVQGVSVGKPWEGMAQGDSQYPMPTGEGPAMMQALKLSGVPDPVVAFLEQSRKTGSRRE